ncbi:gamma-glutamyltranspeptidase [Rubrobacter xylanophilus]|uniref:Glutathione hydrolase proenzyme n=1 Tax=Rubrobacter xylanophilus TaxID=49319 RepID=A0A510HHI6_9ACTN|nr:gamma-glutamyltransferase [Rubrobacter xylanophilus]BBL78725.1 gamma-glutamyltranspeptidase [Rubrobacter xylanophilus]
METYGTPRAFAAAAGTPYAAEAAAEIYRSGGNAVDAAVAAAAAVGVTEPLMSSIGGGGFALVRTPGGAVEVVDFFDVMPGKGLPPSAFGAGGRPHTVLLDYGAGVSSIVGGPSVAVPGAVRGWEELLKRHGRLTLRETLAPAVRLAREGFRLCRTSALWFRVAREVLALTEETRRNFYRDGRVYEEGEKMCFPELADTLEAIGEEGADLFYEGELGRKISAYVRKMGGLITERDLAEYRPEVRSPLTVGYRDGEIHTNGPPSAGGATLAQMLRIVAGYDLSALPEEEYVRVVAGAMRLALLDREERYADGSRNAEVVGKLLGEEHIASQRKKLFGPHTTHLSCADAEGYAVAITASMGYGSGLVVPGTGIPLNNVLGEPELNPGGFHALSPGERPVSSMSPTIVSSAREGVIALGSPGATRIPTAILQTILNVVDLGMPLGSAVLTPRFHAEGDLFAYEAGARTADLDAYGRVLVYEEPSMYFGGVNAVRRTPEGTFEAAADPRRSGGAAYA